VSAVQSSPAGLAEAYVSKLTADGTALEYSTYLGGSRNDQGERIAVDAAGNAYVTGWLVSRDFPIVGPIQDRFGGGLSDAFVARLQACAPLPAAVELLMARKEIPGDVLLSWAPASLADGGYHLYAVDSKRLVPTANRNRTPVCNVAAARTDCRHAGGLSVPPSELYYQVVAVCADGASEGPL
jgi:hypothetical protein